MNGPPWIKDFSASVRWANRWPFAWNTTGKSTSTAYTGQLTIPEAFDAFWDTAAAAELRITTNNGRTAIPFDDVNLNIAGRSGYLIVRPTVVTASKMEIGWLYWDADGATDTSSTIADATDLTFAIDIGGPIPPFVPCVAKLGDTLGTKIQKDSAAKIAVYYRLPQGSQLAGGAAGWTGYEAPQHWSITADPGLTAALADTRIVQDAQRNLFVKVLVSGGSDNTTDKPVDLELGTTQSRDLIGTVSLDIENLE